MSPFKCPECGVWWTGVEHRCKKPSFASGTNWSPPPTPPVVWPPVVIHPPTRVVTPFIRPENKP